MEEGLASTCAGLDVHKKTVVAAVRLVEGNKVTTEVRTFATTTAGLDDDGGSLGCMHVAMETTRRVLEPVWMGSLTARSNAFWPTPHV